MNLSKLLEGVQVSKLFQTMYGRMVVTHDVDVHAIQYDSRKVTKGDCFVAIKGLATDGHLYISEAVSKGASVVVLEDDMALPDSYFMHAGVLKVVVPDSRKALAKMSATYYGNPSASMTMVGVTGTNGKTTTTHLVKSIFEASGQKVGLIGTIDYLIGKDSLPAHFTTPEALELNDLLKQMQQSGCNAVSMEVSSHALQQLRVHGISYGVGVFTNLTQDHLDYHDTMEKYFEAKKQLFDSLSTTSWAVINFDDDYGKRLLKSSTSRTLSYGFQSNADVYVESADLSVQGSTIKLRHGVEIIKLETSLAGRFNVYNVMAACATGLASEIPISAIQEGIRNIKSIKGRLERLTSRKGWTAFIDYAHTPDALEKCLTAIRELLPEGKRGKIITVFGAGGDRDRSKRPLMGRAVSSLSDVVVVTSDNPRTEDPEKIMKEIVRGILPNTKLLQIVNRREAIIRALEIARPGDAVVIAGKGHEEYQLLGKERIHFSDREIVEEYI